MSLDWYEVKTVKPPVSMSLIRSGGFSGTTRLEVAFCDGSCKEVTWNGKSFETMDGTEIPKQYVWFWREL